MHTLIPGRVPCGQFQGCKRARARVLYISIYLSLSLYIYVIKYTHIYLSIYNQIINQIHTSMAGRVRMHVCMCAAWAGRAGSSRAVRGHGQGCDTSLSIYLYNQIIK